MNERMNLWSQVLIKGFDGWWVLMLAFAWLMAPQRMSRKPINIFPDLPPTKKKNINILESCRLFLTEYQNHILTQWTASFPITFLQGSSCWCPWQLFLWRHGRTVPLLMQHLFPNLPSTFERMEVWRLRPAELLHPKQKRSPRISHRSIEVEQRLLWKRWQLDKWKLSSK